MKVSLFGIMALVMEQAVAVSVVFGQSLRGKKMYLLRTLMPIEMFLMFPSIQIQIQATRFITMVNGLYMVVRVVRHPFGLLLLLL